MLVDRVGELAMLVLGKERIVDDRAIGLFASSFVAASRRFGEFQKLARTLRPWLMIFCCCISFVKRM
jgi:hypothetical protein